MANYDVLLAFATYLLAFFISAYGTFFALWLIKRVIFDA